MDSNNQLDRMTHAVERTRFRVRRVNPPCDGFTLIELLASMTVLVFIVMAMAKMFSDASSIWSSGAKRVSAASEGRAIMDFMVVELTQAIADERVTFKLNSTKNLYGVSAYGAQSDELIFAAIVQPGRADNRRNADQFAYFIAPMLNEKEQILPNRYRLARTRRTASMYSNASNLKESAYQDPNWWETAMEPRDDYGEEYDVGTDKFGAETVADNVVAFEVWAYSAKTEYSEPDYNSVENDNLLPLWLDVYLELLGDEEAERAALLWDANPGEARDYIARNVKRYTTRVFFPNRERANAFPPQS